MDAREIESLSMLSRGFSELKEANPELAYNVILDILSGINEYVPFQSLNVVLRLMRIQQLRCTTSCSDLSWFVPPQAYHPEERNDCQGPRRHRSPRGYFWFTINSGLGGGEGGGTGVKEVSYLRTDIHAVVGGPAVEVAESDIADCTYYHFSASFGF
jgi:serine/threonine-protein kinase 24/25/MST4